MFIFYRTCFAILHSIFHGKCEKERLFLGYVDASNNVAFVYKLT